MMKHLLLCAWLCCALISTAQPDENLQPGPNLIANPGFEKLRREIPNYDLDGSIAFRNAIDKWMSPTKTTPDLKMNINQEGTDLAHLGQSMVGILSHNPQSKRSDTYREYIQTKLLKPLQAGEEYYLEFWICRAHNAALVSNNIGVAFSPVPIIQQDYEPLLNLQPVLNETAVINAQQKAWVKIAGTFVANQRAQFLILGNFFDNEHTIFEKAPDASPDAFNQPYYLIDDIALHQLHLQPEPEALVPAAEIKVGQVIQLDRIYFETAKWDLLAASYTELKQLHHLLEAHPSMKIAIHGHTDSKGGEAYNQNLSEQRARAVYEYLQNQGVAEDRIAYEGFGELRPVATNTTDAGRQTNRRVEFVILALDEDNTTIENISTAQPEEY